MDTDKTNDDGGPAYPLSVMRDNGYGQMFPDISPGMTLRDFFAAHALEMTGAACDAVGPECDPMPHAVMAYRIADAMILARKVSP